MYSFEISITTYTYYSIFELTTAPYICSIVENYLQYYFFISLKNVDLASCPPENRRVPTIEEMVKLTGLAARGGLCFQLNYFFKLLLNSLGYTAFTIAGTVGVNKGDHIMTIVKFSEHEMYLIDVGCGNPTKDIVPLHKLPFTAKAAGSYFYEFRQIGDGQYARYQVGGGLLFGDYVSSMKLI